MKNLHLVLVLFSIASMFTSFGVYDVDAAHDNKNGKAKSNGCDKENNPNQAKNNPHCNETSTTSCPDPKLDSDQDGIPDCQDKCNGQYNEEWIKDDPDHDNDGTIDSEDLTPCPPV